MNRINILILAVSLILAAFAHGGLYQIVITSAGSGGSNEATGDVEETAVRLNRFTGKVMMIRGDLMVEVTPYHRPVR